MDKNYKIIVEKHPDGYVAYPLGIKGVVVGEGDTYEAALADVKSAIQFHIETFGPDVFRDEETVLEAYVTETGVTNNLAGRITNCILRTSGCCWAV